MTTNQTIDGVLGLLSLLERLRIPDGVYIEYAHGAGQDFEDALRELRALLDKEVTGDSRAPQTQGEPVTIDDNVEFEKWWMSTPTLRKQKIQIAQEAWFARAKLAEHPAPVAPTPINYGALDPVERLAVCRGEVASVVDAPNPDDKNQGESAPVMKSWRCDEPGTPGVWSKSKITSGSVALITEGPFRGQIVVLDHADSPRPFLIYRGAGQLARSRT